MGEPIALTFGGVLQQLHEIRAAWFEPGIARGVALMVLLGMLMALIEMPFDLYRTFVVEERFAEEELASVFPDVDLPLLPVLVKMERAGIIGSKPF